MKCKDVRKYSPERGRKTLKCEQSIELSAVMETFNMRWEKTWEWDTGKMFTYVLLQRLSVSFHGAVLLF